MQDQDRHPAACVDCCKQVIDRYRVTPAFIEDAEYFCRQIVFLCVAACGAALFAPFMFLSWVFGTGRKKMISDRVVREITVTLHDPPIHCTAQERAIIQKQHQVLDGLIHRLQHCDPPDRGHIIGEVREQQTIHNDYVNLVKCRIADWTKRRDEMIKLACEIDAIRDRAAAGIADDGELRRHDYLCDRLAQVDYEASKF